MQAFRYTRRGAESRLEPEERRLLAQVVADVAQVLGTHLSDRPDAAPTPGRRPSPHVDGTPRYGPGATGRGTDEEILAALDFDPAEDARGAMPADPALARLLPPASLDDPELAAEWRRLTGAELRARKSERLASVHRELCAPTGSAGRVLVARGHEGEWLATLTDVRLVLATRLGVEDDVDVDRVHRLAQGEVLPPRTDRPERRLNPDVPAGPPRTGPRAGGREIAHPEDDPWDDVWEDEEPDEARDEADVQLEIALASLYTALTWWQESLLQSMGESGPPT